MFEPVDDSDGELVGVKPLDGDAEGVGVGVGAPGVAERLAAKAPGAVERFTPQTSGVASVAVRWQPVAASKTGAGKLANAAGAGPQAKRMLLV